LHWFWPFFLAWLTYRFVEKPIRCLKAGRRRVLTTTALLGCAAIVGAVSIAGFGVVSYSYLYPKPLQPFAEYGYREKVGFTRCFLQARQNFNDWQESACVERQTSPAQPLLVYWGDPHAAVLAFGLKALQREKKFRLGEMAMSLCPPFLGFDEPDAPFCKDENQNYLQHIVKLKPDIVLLSALWPDHNEMLDGTIRALKRGGIRNVVILGPVPTWKHIFPEMLVHIAIHNNNQIPESLGPEYYEAGPEKELKLLAARNGASYISALDALCPGSQCMTMAGGYGPENETFIDTNHVSVAGSVFLIKKIAAQLFPALMWKNAKIDDGAPHPSGRQARAVILTAMLRGRLNGPGTRRR
jgi:hypothetical protein